MDHFQAVMIAEGVERADSVEQYIEAWQYLIDTNVARHLQGFFGRTAAGLIEAGQCHARKARS
jgi:hypothetical protein